jgi:putative acetyltransferase
MLIRKFELTDAQELADLFYSTIREVNIKDYSLEQVKAWAPEDRNFEEWKQSFKDKVVFVAIKSEAIVGFGELESSGHIDRFYIHKNHLGKKVARQIYQAIEEEAIYLGIKRLFVEASITAKPFFLKMNFDHVQEQKVILRGIEFINYRMEKIIDG